VLPAIRDSVVIDANEVWLVTEDGRILSIVGKTAIEITSDLSAQEIDLRNGRDAWLLDSAGNVWSTENRGEDWSKLGSIRFGALDQPSTISFASNDVGWIVIGGGLLLTEDGGRNWSQVTVPEDLFASNKVRFPYDIYVIDPDKAVVTMGGSGGSIVQTLDRGRTWKDISHPKDVEARSAWILNDRELWVGTWNAGGLYHTTDSGATWQQVLPDEVRNNLGISSVSFASANVGWFTGIEFTKSIDESPDGKGVVYKSTDRGQTWTKQENPLYKTPFQKIVFPDPLHGWLIGEKVVYRTNNGGDVWEEVFKTE
jgi:photosystem II stability/assembly factor-like uncharacterized protein